MELLAKITHSNIKLVLNNFPINHSKVIQCLYCTVCVNAICSPCTAMDVSADLTELGRTPLTVVSAGIKSILDIGLTLEYLVRILNKE